MVCSMRIGAQCATREKCRVTLSVISYEKLNAGGKTLDIFDLRSAFYLQLQFLFDLPLSMSAPPNCCTAQH